MRFWAVFKTTAEKHVLIDADNWQDAARIANEMGPQKITETAHLEVVGMVEDDDLDEDYICTYDSVHEILGPCNKCGFQIIERGCDSEACKESHKSEIAGKSGGWCNTEHGHVQWCSQECRDADRENDCDLDVLDRMSGVTSADAG